VGEFCYSCFAELEKAGICPHCGYDPREDIDKYPNALKPGTILNDRYIVGRVLGQGGFGITYAALDYESRALMAIKEYLPEVLASRDATGQVTSYAGQRTVDFNQGKEGFLDEANTLVDFKNNPYIVNIHDYFEQNGTAYFVMEFVRGMNLKTYVRRMGGRLGQKEAERILLPIMEALEDVHSKGLVHRDIAPDNIIVTADGAAKLIDFGAARYSTGEKSLSLDVVLKHGYAPIEQYSRHSRQGAFTDVYAMAATYYFAVTGRVPPDSIDRVSRDGLVSPAELGVKLSEDAEKTIRHALGVQSEDRCQSMADLIKGLRGGEKPEEPVKPTPAPKPEKKEKPKKEPKPKKEKVKKELPKTDIKAKLKALKAKITKKHLIIAAAVILAPLVILGAIRGVNGLIHSAIAEFRFNEKTGVLTIRRDCSYPAWWEYDGRAVKVIVKEGVSSLPDEAFEDFVLLESVELPSTLETIGDKAFVGCESLKTVSISEGLQVIGEYAFHRCEQLESAALPQSVKVIGSHAFAQCYALQEAAIPQGIESIGDGAFAACSSLSRVVIPEGITQVDNWFINCGGVTELVLPSTLQVIGTEAFQNFDSLTEVTIPEGVTVIGEQAFYDCDALVKVNFNQGLLEIGEDAFSYCDALSELDLPNTLLDIGARAFYRCKALTEVVIPNSVTHASYSIFEDCTALKRVELSSSMNAVNAYFFEGCESLEEIVVPVSILSFNNDAFEGCKGFSIYYGGTKDQWNKISFWDTNLDELKTARIYYNS